MAKFMDIHDGFFGVTAQQLAEAHQRDLDVEGHEGVHYEHAWLDPESGKVFCLATGPSKEAVMRVHERAGPPDAAGLRGPDRGRLTVTAIHRRRHSQIRVAPTPPTVPRRPEKSGGLASLGEPFLVVRLVDALVDVGLREEQRQPARRGSSPR